MKIRGYLLALVILFTFSLHSIAVLPNSAIYIPFDADWDSQTSAGSEFPVYNLYNNRAPFSTDGVFGNSLKLSADSHFTPGGSVYFQDGGYTDAVLDSGLQQFTICGWFRSDTASYVNGTTLLIRKGPAGVTGSGFLRIVFDNFGRLRLVVNGVDENDVHWFATEDTWTFFAVTYDGSASVDNVAWYYGTETQATYLQYGENGAYGTLDAGTLGDSNSPLVIGSTNIEGQYAFDGAIDELRVYNQILTAEQIEEARQLINNTPPTDPLFDPEFVPEPIIYLPYDGDWDNKGSAGVSGVTILTGYDEVNDLVIGPDFAEGLSGQCLDLTMRTSHTAYLENGGVLYENYNDPNLATPMKDAINGLKSFTLCGWFKVDEPGIGLGDGSSILFYQRRDGLTTQKLRFYTDPYGRPRGVLNGDVGPLSPYAYWSIKNGVWNFKAVTYYADDFGNEEKYYYGSVDGNAAFRAVRSHPAGVLEDSNEPIQVCPQFDGYADELYFFGSKTDSSGALTLEQIQYVASRVHREILCGTEGHPVPQGDINSDCLVDFSDLELMSGNWLYGK